MAVHYLKDYLGVDPNDYSAMEQGIAGISPLAANQSIIPQTASMPRASIMSEGDFANATAPLMNRVYGREQEARGRAEGLSNELQALKAEMAQTSEAEVEKRAALERQMQETMQRENDAKRELERQMQNFSQERDTSRTTAEDLASQLQGVQANLQEITQARDTAVQDYQDALAQQDVIRQQASENEAIQLEEQRNSLLAEREGIVTTLEQDFGVQRSELESLVGDLEGKVGELESVRGSLQGEIDNLSGQMQSLELEKQDALAQQDTIRAESAQAQQEALAQQAEQFTGERTTLEQQIADLQAQISQPPTGQLPPGQAPPGETPPGPPPGMINYEDFLAQGGSAEDYQKYLNKFLFSSDNLSYQMDGLQNPSQEAIDAVQNSLATGVPAITNQGVQDMLDKAPMPPKRDQLFIDDGPKNRDDFKRIGDPREIPKRPPFIAELPPKDIGVPLRDIGVPKTPVGPAVGGGPVERFPISVGVPGTDMFKQFPIPGRPKVGGPAIPPRDQLFIDDGPPLRRANGGSINAALAELRNKIR